MLEVVDVSGLVTVQDAGRSAYRKFGVPVSGAMDQFAMRAANILVGNAIDQPVIEVGLGDALFRALSNCVVSITGAGYETGTYIWTYPLWTSFFVRAGWTIKVNKTNGGNWAYLAIAGGFKVDQVLGSSSAYLRGGMGAMLETGMRLQSASQPRDLQSLAARVFPVTKRPSYSQNILVDVIPGPQVERFTKKGMKTFYSSEYTLSRSFDRMGYRLEGESIEHANGADMISEGMTTGSIQVPASGQPIVMMADGPTTGGYPKIANVITADLPLLAQCEPGVGKIRFNEVSVVTAQEKYKHAAALLGR
jgi:biotin-dependent carboxylase-like uncharacterized protein